MRIVERVYELEAARLQAGAMDLSWRVSVDVRDELAASRGLRVPNLRTFTLVGYPAVVDGNLPPNSLVCEGSPAVAS